MTIREKKLILAALYSAMKWEDSFAEANDLRVEFQPGRWHGKTCEPAYSDARKQEKRYQKLRDKLRKEWFDENPETKAQSIKRVHGTRHIQMPILPERKPD